MKRLLFFMTLVFASPAAADKISLNELSSYLNGLQTAKGEFAQVNGDGSITTGTLHLKRPGRMRFENNPPDKAMIIVGGGQVAVFDPKSDEPTRFPLNQTPLKIILERQVNLAQRNMVVGHSSDGTRTTIVAQDPKRPEYGNIQLVFTDDPVQLRQWIVDDNSGNITTVILGDWQEGGSVPNRLFNIQSEMEKWDP